VAQDREPATLDFYRKSTRKFLQFLGPNLPYLSDPRKRREKSTRLDTSWTPSRPPSAHELLRKPGGRPINRGSIDGPVCPSQLFGIMFVTHDTRQGRLHQAFRCRSAVVCSNHAGCPPQPPTTYVRLFALAQLVISVLSPWPGLLWLSQFRRVFHKRTHDCRRRRCNQASAGWLLCSQRWLYRTASGHSKHFRGC
jgi:hypothetical protein